MGLTAHFEKIQVNNHSQDEKSVYEHCCMCGRSRHTGSTWRTSSHGEHTYMENLIKILKELGAVRLANALAQRTDILYYNN